MKTQILNSFPLCAVNKCLETVNYSYFEILDDDEYRSIILRPPSKGNFKVKNSIQRDINFLAIDKALFDNTHPYKRCDCAIFDDACFSFIEIKVVSCPKQRARARKEAIEQLKATLDCFTAVIDFKHYNLEAHVCIGSTHTSPYTNATQTNNKVEFMSKYNAVLLEGNNKDY